MDSVNFTLPGDVEKAAIYFAIQLIKSDQGKPIGDAKGVKIGKFKVDFPAADAMTGSGSGYWAESVGDPYIVYMPLQVRRALLPYRNWL